MTGNERLDTMASAIKEQVEAGSKLLENTLTRMRVCAWIGAAGMHKNPEQIGAEILMPELTKSFIKVWPDALNLQAFERIEQELPPLRRVRDLMDHSELKQWVLLSCEPVITDTRIPVIEFKKTLWNKVFNQ